MSHGWLAEAKRQLAPGLVTGLALGALVGGLELVYIIVTTGDPPVPRSDILLAMVMYALFWGCVGAFFGLFGSVYQALRGSRGRAEGDRRWTAYACLVLTAILFVELFAFANHENDTPFAARSLLVDLGLLVGVVGVGLAGWGVLGRLARRVAVLPRILAGLCGALLLVLLVTALVPTQGAREEERPVPAAGLPNVIIMLVDTLRADHLGVFGYERDTSPNLDEFTRDAVLFERCISQSSSTPPATVSLLTSLHPPTHNHGLVLSVLPAGVRMMPDAMGRFGYRTAFISTNPLVSRSYGFARSVDLYRGAHSQASYRTNLYHAVILLKKIEQRVLGPDGVGPVLAYRRTWRALSNVLHPGEFRDDAAWVHGEFLRWLDRQEEDAPIFAYLHYMEPHRPWEPDAPFDEMFRQEGYEGPPLRHPPRISAAHPPVMKSSALDDDDLHRIVANYDGEIADWDHHFGIFLEELKKRGLYDSTLIVVVADHGEEFYEHETWGHGHSLFQEVIHVPLIVKLPGNRHGGVRVAGQVRSVDLLPTLLDVAGLERWEGLQGASLMPVIEAGDEHWGGREAYSEINAPGFHGRALLAEGGKVMEVRLDRSYWYLFDLAGDPRELEPVAEGAQVEQAALRLRLEEVHEGLAEGAMNSSAGELDPEMEQRLRELGYIE
jgi:arylsulfatase A-like enzyme